MATWYACGRKTEKKSGIAACSAISAAVCIPAGDIASRRWSTATSWSARPAAPTRPSWRWTRKPAAKSGGRRSANLGDQGGDGAGYSSIVIGNGGGVRQYVQLMGRGVVGVDASTGKFLWGYNRVANRTANIPTPLVDGDYVFCSSGYRTGAALLKLVPDGRRRRGRRSVLSRRQGISKPSRRHDHAGRLRLCRPRPQPGAPTCLNWKTGETVWRHNRGPGTGSAAVAYADGNLYFRFQNGVMALIGATPERIRRKRARSRFPASSSRVGRIR